MRNIIIYGTKYGTAEKAARILKSKLNDQADLVNVMKEKVPSLEPYDTIVFGGSIYMGRIQKEISDCIKRNLTLLLQRRVGLFICAGSPDIDARIKELESVFPKELYEKAICKEMFGHEICYEKLNFLDKIIMKSVKGNKENSSDFSEEKIESFAKALMAN